MFVQSAEGLYAECFLVSIQSSSAYFKMKNEIDMRRIVWLLVFFIFVNGSSAQILNSLKDVVKPTETSWKKSLNGEWDFFFIGSEDWKEYSDFYREDYIAEGWSKISVPGCWDALGYVTPKYANPDSLNGLYRTFFTIPKLWKGNHVFISFDGVLRGYEVWVNGYYAGKWESSYNTCHFDITDYLKDGKNLLAVRVYTHYKGFDFDGNDDWGQVGINREVSLFAVPKVHIKDFTLRTENVSEDSAKVRMFFDIASFGKEMIGKAWIKGTLKDPDGNVVTHFKEYCSDSGFVRKELMLTNPVLWNAETPRLYQLEYSLHAPECVQEFSSKFGVREVTIRKNVILLNGHKVKLRGINLHETDPFNGKVVSEELNLKDLRMMKEANINFIRCSHYPRDPRFYQLCDSIGMYVMSEVPFGYGDSHLYDDSYQDILLTRADATVRRDKNSACILFWSIGNENPLTPITEETGCYVKRLDPTRPICYPMIHNYFLSLDFELPDFIDVFAPHYPPVATLRYYAEAAKRPVILTEYCHSLGQSFEQHKDLWELIEQNDNLAGGCVWEWCDQGMIDRSAVFPGKYIRTEKVWLKDGKCINMEGNSGTDGMLYAERTPLSNYYELRKNYAQAFILTDSLIGSIGKNRWNVEIANRFDFVDLSEKVSFRWMLVDGKKIKTQGDAVLKCSPGNVALLPIEAILDTEPSDVFYCLKIDVFSNEGYCLGNYSVPIVSNVNKQMKDLFDMVEERVLQPDTLQMQKVLSTLFQEPLLMRVGRKLTMSEELKAQKAIKHYLVKEKNVSTELEGLQWKQKMNFENSEIQTKGEIIYEQLANDGIRVNYRLVPKAKGKMMLEGGIAFMLNSHYTYIQWLGDGPYASYPGKCSANEYGLYGMRCGDLYFEGNRMNVDVVCCSDSTGNGFALIAPHSNINFEQTDKGVVLSINSVVSGLCGKLRETAYPVYVDNVLELTGQVVIIPLQASKWQEVFTYLFKQPEYIEKRDNPFMSQYDTYLLKYSDIVE